MRTVKNTPAANRRALGHGCITARNNMEKYTMQVVLPHIEIDEAVGVIICE